MTRQFHGLRAERVRANLHAVRSEIVTAAAAAGRDPREVSVLAACKYVPAQELPALAAAGVELLGENRAQELQRKAQAHGDLFEWDFIGTLQSKHVRAIVPHVRLIHSLASDSALRELERHLDRARPGLRALVEVNLAGEAGKAGIEPGQLGGFLARSPVPIVGLMTMPPVSDASATVGDGGSHAGDAPSGESSRPWFRRLRELADEHGLRELSMGTTQDFAVAVQEGATIVRIGTRLYA